VSVAVAVAGTGVGEYVSVAAVVGCSVAKVDVGSVVTVPGVNGRVELFFTVGVIEAEGVAGDLMPTFPSARDKERPPNRRPMETRAIRIPRKTGHRFFIDCSLLATQPGQA